VIGGIITLVLGLGILLWVHRRGRRGTQIGEAKQYGERRDTSQSGQFVDEGDNIQLVESPSIAAAAVKMDEAQSQDHDRSAAVEMCDTGFRAELSAGEDVIYRKEKP